MYPTTDQLCCIYAYYITNILLFSLYNVPLCMYVCMYVCCRFMYSVASSSWECIA